MMIDSKTQIENGLKCGICRNQIGINVRIYQEGLNFGVVCPTCHENNSKEDIEFMANMFLAFGGYFGMLKKKRFSLVKTLETLINEVPIDNEFPTVGDINAKILHKALLHGINPQQYIDCLEELLET